MSIENTTSGTDINTAVRTLALVAAAKKQLAEVEARAKSTLAAQLRRGTVYAHNAAGVELGYATVPKASKPKPHIVITDEAQVFAWLTELFGDGMVETVVQLTEQGRKSFEAYVLERYEAEGCPDYFDLPGVAVSSPPVRDPAPRFTPSRNIVDLVQEMTASGELSWTEVLALEGGEGDD